MPPIQVRRAHATRSSSAALTRREWLALAAAALLYIFQPAEFIHQSMRRLGLIRHHAADNISSSWSGLRGNISDWIDSRQKLDDARSLAEKRQWELNILRARLQAQTMLLEENAVLRKLFLLPKVPDMQYLYGDVRARVFRPDLERLVATVTTPVAPGTPALTMDDAGRLIALGQVLASDSNLAEIILLTDPRARLSVSFGDSRPLGDAILSGRGRGAMELDYLSDPRLDLRGAGNLEVRVSVKSVFPAGALAAVQSGSRPDGLPRLVPPISYHGVRFVILMPRLEPAP